MTRWAGHAPEPSRPLLALALASPMGGVSAGQAAAGPGANRTRPRWSNDQTRLFSREKWVRFAWADRQIRRDLVRRYVVRGG